MATWREAVEAAVRRQAARSGGVVTRQQLESEEDDRMRADTGTEGATPMQTVSRVLQEMRDDGIIEFTDDRGTYRLTG